MARARAGASRVHGVQGRVRRQGQPGEASVEPDQAFWLDALGEFALPYDAVRAADDPDAALLAFARSTHAAAADLAGWDRSALESSDPHPPSWWHRNA